MIESAKEIIKIQWTHYSLWIRIFLLYFYIFCSEGEFQNLKCEAKRMGATFLPVLSHIIVVLTVLDYFCYLLLFTFVFTKAVYTLAAMAFNSCECVNDKRAQLLVVPQERCLFQH